MVQASLDFLFYARRTSNSHHKRYSYSLLGPGTLTAHRRFHLVLLHSCPDTVHGVLLRKTQTSTSLIEGSFAMKEPSDWHHPRCSGLRVQGTAISPAARNLIIDSETRFVKVQTEINQFILSVQYCTAPFLVLRRVKLI